MFIFLIFLYSPRLTSFFLSFLFFFSLVHHPTFVWGFSSELDIIPVTLQFIRAHPPLSPLVLRMAGPILQNFKMIPCSKCSPVGLKLNAHLCENLNSSVLVCETMLSHYHQGQGCHLWAFQWITKTAGNGRGYDGFPSPIVPCDEQGLVYFCLACLSVSPSNPTVPPSVFELFLLHLRVVRLCHRIWKVVVEFIWRAWKLIQYQIL